jgi:hypothetical protein
LERDRKRRAAVVAWTGSKIKQRIGVDLVAGTGKESTAVIEAKVISG